LLAAVIALPSSLGAQGIAISVPLPDLDARRFRRYEVVELAGAMPVDGSLLVDGKLPAPVLDYTSEIGGVKQSATMFENGVVSVALMTEAGRVEKKVLLPADALASYRQFFAACDIGSYRPLDPGRDGDRVMLRLATSAGTAIEKSFPASTIVPENVERLRLVVDDLLRALSEDREVTNPISRWEPRVGDTLLGGDEKAYRVVRIKDEFIEVVSTSEPVRRYVPLKDLHLYFVGSLPSEP
jgi:hypothetical protein